MEKRVEKVRKSTKYMKEKQKYRKAKKQKCVEDKKKQKIKKC